jgi:hypothetical protein
LHLGQSRLPAIGGVQDTEPFAEIVAAASEERADDLDRRLSIFLGNNAIDLPLKLDQRRCFEDLEKLLGREHD